MLFSVSNQKQVYYTPAQACLLSMVLPKYLSQRQVERLKCDSHQTTWVVKSGVNLKKNEVTVKRLKFGRDQPSWQRASFGEMSVSVNLLLSGSDWGSAGTNLVDNVHAKEKGQF